MNGKKSLSQYNSHKKSNYLRQCLQNMLKKTATMTKSRATAGSNKVNT